MNRGPILLTLPRASNDNGTALRLLYYRCTIRFRLASVQEQRLPDARLSPTNEETPPITPTSSAKVHDRLPVSRLR